MPVEGQALGVCGPLSAARKLAKSGYPATDIKLVGSST